MNRKETRWRQRFDNFAKVHAPLENHIQNESPDELARAGFIHFFEMAFEFAWKLMKDYLEAQGLQVRSPKDAIKHSFQAELIEDGQTWLDALEDRNLTAHTYDENTALEIEEKIRTEYFPALQQFFTTMNEKSQL